MTNQPRYATRYIWGNGRSSDFGSGTKSLDEIESDAMYIIGELNELGDSNIKPARREFLEGQRDRYMKRLSELALGETVRFYSGQHHEDGFPVIEYIEFKRVY